MAKSWIIKDFTSGTALLSSANGATASVLTISSYDDMVFYASADTGGAGFVATVTAQVSPDGTNFFGYDGIIADAGSAVSQITLATAGSEVFSLRHIDGIKEVRFSITTANANASSTIQILYSARKEDQ